MSVPFKYALYQGPVLRGLGETIVGALKQRAGLTNGTPTVPGPVHSLTVSPRPRDLVDAYVRHVGGEPSSYRGRLPAHLFPQWGFPLQGKLVEGLKYPLLAAMNGGCKLTINAPLPDDEPLEVTGQLVGVDDDGKRAILDQKIVTGTRTIPEAVVAHLYVFVPLAKDKNGKSKEKPRVPTDARELAFWKLRGDAGLDFAKLTGDFNPVHWVPRWAKAFGFKNTILHGFGTMARAIEGLNRARFAGDVNAISEIDVRFTRPLVLPARVGLYLRENQVWVGDAPGGPAYLEAKFTAKKIGEVSGAN
jgi:hypothetical protein